MRPIVKISDSLSVTAQPDQQDYAEIARLGFRTVVNNRPEGEEPGQPTLAASAAEARRHGLAYGHIPVRMDSITKEDIAAFGAAIDRGPQPVLAHCKGGTRSYLLWALWRVTQFRDDPAKLVAEAAARGVDLRALPATLQRLGL